MILELFLQLCLPFEIEAHHVLDDELLLDQFLDASIEFDVVSAEKLYKSFASFVFVECLLFLFETQADQILVVLLALNFSLFALFQPKFTDDSLFFFLDLLSSLESLQHVVGLDFFFSLLEEIEHRDCQYG